MGDQIVEVNGVDFTSVDHKEVNFASYYYSSTFGLSGVKTSILYILSFLSKAPSQHSKTSGITIIISRNQTPHHWEGLVCGLLNELREPQLNNVSPAKMVCDPGFTKNRREKKGEILIFTGIFQWWFHTRMNTSTYVQCKHIPLNLYNLNWNLS